ncbi:MAG TPA: hypothetical protein VNZ45_05500, partial [Bacteroidia bacterium]|nr:hypothetical protein [Bacteroidia bacterium]
MKIKILGTTGLLYVLRLTALAQTDTNSKPLLRECVSINSGIAIPGTVIPSTNPGLGRANEGFSANAYGFIAKRKSLIGFAAFISENINPTVLTNENFGNPTTQIATVSELGIDLGLCIDIPFSRFSLNVRAMLGPAFSTWPSLSYINYFGSGVNFNPGMSCAISFDAGISLRYALSKKMSLSFVSDFFSTYPRYTASGNYQGEEIDANLVLNNYTIGVAYTIGEYAPPAPYVPSFVDSLQMDSIPQDTAKKTYPKAYVYLNGGIGDPGYKFRWFNSAGIGGAIIGNTYSASINIPINHSKMGISLLAGGGFNGFSTQAFNGWEGDQLD